MGPSGLSLVHSAGPLLDVLPSLPLPLLWPWPLLVLSKMSLSGLFPPWQRVLKLQDSPCLGGWERRPGWLGAAQSL